jgi:iron complex outermembrane receptor protein
MADLQYRNVNYDITGTDDNMLDITQSYNYNFVNPKAGAFFKFNEHFDTYASFAIAQKEPKRSDYVDAPTEKKPVPEKLYDYEFGVHTRTQNFQLGVNLYYMYYKDQLINTGELNNVGSAIMVNTPKSYRKGIEITMAAKFDKVLDLSGNLAISRNKINNFTEYVAVYDESWNPQGTKVIDHGKSDIAYSPNVVANIIAKLHVTKDLDIDWTRQYVGKQYIDNTSSNDRVIDAYSFTNVKASYRLNIPHTKKSIIWAQVNNLFDQKYSSNAWVYSYYENDKRMDSIGLFPQAGINWTIGLSLSL